MTAPEERFVAAFKLLRESNKIQLTQFCRDLGIPHSNFSFFMRGDSTRHSRVEWFSELCRYGVSADWLLTGRGPMFNNKNIKS